MPRAWRSCCAAWSNASTCSTPMAYVRSWNTARTDQGLQRQRDRRPVTLALLNPETWRWAPEQGLSTARDAGGSSRGLARAQGWAAASVPAGVIAPCMIQPPGRLRQGDPRHTERTTQNRRGAGARSPARITQAGIVGKLTLGLAHDFNNLITIVVNSLELIGRRPTAERALPRAGGDRLAGLRPRRPADAPAAGLRPRQALAPELCDIAELLENSSIFTGAPARVGAR